MREGRFDASPLDFDAFKLGELIKPSEHELIHGIKDFENRLNHMNWRLVGASLHAVRMGIPIDELVQF
jgi:hypothetical protein